MMFRRSAVKLVCAGALAIGMAACSSTATDSTPDQGAAANSASSSSAADSSSDYGTWVNPSAEDKDLERKVHEVADLCASWNATGAGVLSGETLAAMRGIDLSPCAALRTGESLGALNDVTPLWDAQCLTGNGWSVTPTDGDPFGATLTSASGSGDPLSIAQCSTGITATPEQCDALRSGSLDAVTYFVVLTRLGCAPQQG